MHFPPVNSKAQYRHKSLVTRCARVALNGMAGLLVLGKSLSQGKPLFTLVTLHTLDLTLSLVLQGSGLTSESSATNTPLERVLVLVLHQVRLQVGGDGCAGCGEIMTTSR